MEDQLALECAVGMCAVEPVLIRMAFEHEPVAYRNVKQQIRVALVRYLISHYALVRNTLKFYAARSEV